MRYVAEDSTLVFKFTARRFSTGAPHTLAGTPSLAIYADDSATPITAGITLSVDYDSKTGLNHVSIDLSASASYAAGKTYTVEIAAGTIDSVSVVGEVIYDFYIHAAGGLEALITRGLLALPAAAPGAAGGLTFSTAGGLDLDAQRAAITAIQTTLKATALVQGTIGSTGNDTTHLHLTGLTYGDDEINDYLLVILDASTNEYHSRWIADWVLSTELATVATLPFTPQNATDTYWLLPGVGDAPTATLDAAGVRAAVGLGSANLDTQLDALPTAAENAAATEAAILNEGDATALLAAIAAKIEEFLINEGDATATLAAIAAAVRTNLATELARIDAAITTRMATYTQPTGFLAASFPTDPADHSVIIAATDALLAAINALNNITAAAAATAVRSELATELARIDQKISDQKQVYRG